jgi:pyroglutamyl-peptidase
MEKKLLITGFDPFGGGTVNPSWEAVKLLPDQVGEYKVCKLAIPTVFGVAAKMILAQAQQIHPNVIISVGLAGGRDAVTPERIAVNIRDARIADNQGFQPSGERVVGEGPAAYFSTLPVEQIVQAIRQAGIPAAVSNTAGTFVCNDVLYTLLHHFDGTSVRAGFIHVPYLPSQGTPNMELQDIVKALAAAIEAL